MDYIRGKQRTMIDSTLSASIHNRFDIEVVDTQTGTVRQKAVGYNCICDQLWDRLLSNYDYFRYIHYGTGSGTPASSDKALFKFLGSIEATDSGFIPEMSIKGQYLTCTRKIQITPSIAVGSELTEVGIGYGTAESTLCTHAMLKDMNGNRITIIKSDTDIINVYATIFLHFGQSDSGISFVPLTLRPLYDRKYPKGFEAWLFGIASMNLSYLSAVFLKGNNQRMGAGPASLDSFKEKSYSTTTFDKINKTVKMIFNRLEVENCNIDGGIGCIAVNTFESIGGTSAGQCFGGELALFPGGTWFPNSTISGEAIGTGDGATKDFKTAFNMVQSASVKVDGIADSSISVDFNLPGSLDDMGNNFKLLGLKQLSPDDIEPSSCNVNEPVGYYYRYGGLAEAIYYNPFYQLGIDSFTVVSNKNTEVLVSENMEDWKSISYAQVSKTVVTVPDTYKRYRYWKIKAISGDGDVRGIALMKCSRQSNYNIHFTSPPANGAVITADYTTKTIAKDTNHVFDLAVTLQLGEYTGA